MTTDPIGLYIHIPFCLKKCAYCDFCSFSSVDSEDRELYINALCLEIESYRKKRISINSIFFGGGTPSLLYGKEFRKIVDAIYNAFEVSPDTEFTIEVNPKTLTEENLRDYMSVGVNRISIGLQSIHENELKKLGRIHSFEDFRNTYNLVRRCGIKNVSIDLMYGIPNQTKETFSKTLDYVIGLSPEHISLYGLIIEEGTHLYDNLSDYILPSEDDECDMYYLAAKTLRENGYSHYEISNYSKPGFSCRHNLKYWREQEYIGVGIAAYSYFDGKRYGNSRDFQSYLKDFARCRVDDEEIDRDARKYEYVMLALRLREGFSLFEYKKLFDEDFLLTRQEKVKSLSSAGLLIIKDDRIALTESGMYVSNSILSELL